jgi:hypothetical protein
LSRKHGHRKKKRKHRPAIACPRCHGPADSSPGALLRAFAAVLNSCADEGVKVKMRHGVILAEGPGGGGYVLPLPGGRWTVRTLTYDPLAPPACDDIED